MRGLWYQQRCGPALNIVAALIAALLQMAVRTDSGDERVYIFDLLKLLPKYATQLDNLLQASLADRAVVKLGQELCADMSVSGCVGDTHPSIMQLSAELVLEWTGSGDCVPDGGVFPQCTKYSRGERDREDSAAAADARDRIEAADKDVPELQPGQVPANEQLGEATAHAQSGNCRATSWCLTMLRGCGSTALWCLCVRVDYW